jgi:glutaconate CoA-transferase subunit A
MAVPETTVCNLEALAAAVPDGALLAIAKDSSGVAMAATRELVRRGVRDLHLLCVPISGMQADLLIGAGCVRTLESSGVSLGEYGAAPRFVAALKARSLRMIDSTCPAVYAALQAGQKGIPFIPLRGLLGTDVLVQRTDWKVIDNPFEPDDPIVLLGAIRPDVALLHAKLADRAGNVFIGRERDLLMLAHAARRTLITVEEITDENLLEDEARAGAVIPSIYVERIALAPRGAWPVGLMDCYAPDEAEIARYADLARTPEGFARYLNQWLGERRQAA